MSAIIEWPAVIRQPRHSNVACVTSDLMPTVLDLLGLRHPKPDRPLDGISLKALLVDRRMIQRPSPIGFWKYPSAGEAGNERWVAKQLSTGTTPTTKQANILLNNYRHPVARVADFGGDAAWTDTRYKLVVIAAGKGVRKGKKQRATAAPSLYDLQADPKEAHDIAASHPEIVAQMQAQLEAWQRSVERSLSGADY